MPAMLPPFFCSTIWQHHQIASEVEASFDIRRRALADDRLERISRRGLGEKMPALLTRSIDSAEAGERRLDHLAGAGSPDRRDVAVHAGPPSSEAGISLDRLTLRGGDHVVAALRASVLTRPAPMPWEAPVIAIVFDVDIVFLTLKNEAPQRASVAKPDRSGRIRWSR